MAERSFDKIVRDLSSDFTALRNDLRKLTDVVTELAHDQADDSRGGLLAAVGKARDRYVDTAERLADRASKVRERYAGTTEQWTDQFGKVRDRYSDVSDRISDHVSSASGRVKGAGAELEGRIGRNPFTAVMLAVLGGLVIGAYSRSRP